MNDEARPCNPPLVKALVVTVMYMYFYSFVNTRNLFDLGHRNNKNSHYNVNESTAGTDASVEVPKLHNIKLLASFYTIIA